MFKLEVPSLMVGTLDSLMNLSDDLGKTDSLIESVVRKVEKSSADLAGKKFNASELTVGGVPPTRYVQQFAWDYAKYPNRRPLKELVTLISSGVAAIDEELKQLSTSYGDKTVALQDAKRKKGGNLMTVDLNDVLDEKMVRGLEIHDSEYLKSLFVAVGKGQVEGFEREVYGMGAELVGYGGELLSLLLSLFTGECIAIDRVNFICLLRPSSHLFHPQSLSNRTRLVSKPHRPRPKPILRLPNRPPPNKRLSRSPWLPHQSHPRQRLSPIHGHHPTWNVRSWILRRRGVYSGNKD